MLSEFIRFSLISACAFIEILNGNWHWLKPKSGEKMAKIVVRDSADIVNITNA